MTENALAIERRDQPDETRSMGGGALLLTPPVTEDYWAYRVVVGDGQAIVGFPKFTAIGIGFAVEEDWNTNLPYSCDTDKIWQHIAHNKGSDAIADETCIEAIRMVQAAAREDRDGD